MHSDGGMGSVFLELCAAFDIIDHNILIDGLRIKTSLCFQRKASLFIGQNLVWSGTGFKFGPLCFLRDCLADGLFF